MFKIQIEELFYFQAKEPLLSKYNVVKQKRDNINLYEFDYYKWVLIPEDYPYIYEEDLEKFSKTNDMRIMFNKSNSFDNIIHKNICRLLTEKDKYKFEEFHKACSEEDKNNGMVSLYDPTVYGCFVDDKLVSVASLWHWGNNLSDIGVLTHPHYRSKGYAQSVCAVLMSENDRHYIWRCDYYNAQSVSLGKRLGFIEVGRVYSLEKK